MNPSNKSTRIDDISKLTKAEVSLEDIGKNDELFNSRSALGMHSHKIATNSTFSQDLRLKNDSSAAG